MFVDKGQLADELLPSSAIERGDGRTKQHDEPVPNVKQFHNTNNNITTMGTTEKRQKVAKTDMDQKLALSRPDRALLEELAVACAKNPGSQEATFQYAFALSKSTEPSELRYAVSMLDGLVVEGFEHQVDCMFGAATALYLLGEYEEARVSCPSLFAFALSFIV